MKHLRLPIVYSIVLHSGQWLNKPKKKAEKGGEGGECKRNEEKTLLEKEQCLW